MYHDAYTLQKVEPKHLASFNFAAGMVPFLLNLIQDVSRRMIIIICTERNFKEWRVCIVIYILICVQSDRNKII